MPIINLIAKYRPIRVGLLVRPNNVDDLARASELSTLLWGGAFNPIIPIADDGEDNALCEQLMAVFRPDTLFGVAETASIDAFVETHPFLRDPGHLGEHFFYEDWPSKKNAIAYLDVVNIVDRIWRNPPSTREAKMDCVLARWDPTDSLATLFAVEFGRYPANENLRDDFTTAFLNGLNARMLEIPLHGPVVEAIGTAVTPLRLTTYDLRKSGGDRIGGAGIFVGRENDVSDLTTFWNLRAAGANLRFCPLNSFERLRASLQSFLERIDGIDSSRSPTFDRITIIYSCSDDEARPIINNLHATKRLSRWKYTSHTWNDLHIRPTHNYFDWQRSTGTVERSYGRYQITMAFPEKKFLRNVDEARYIGQQLLAVSIDPYGEFGYEGSTLRLPFLPDLNEFYSREVTVDPWKLRVERDGFALLIHADDEGNTVLPIDNGQLISKLFEYAGIKNEVGQAGRLAATILGRMREHDPLEACRVFKIRGVRILLKHLKPPVSVSAGEAMRIIWNDGQFKEHEDLYIESRKKRKLSTSEVLRFLVEKGVMEPRIGRLRRMFSSPQKTPCDNCGLTNRVRIRDYENPSWKCGYCAHEQDLRIRVAKKFPGHRGWAYHRSGLFAKDNNQEGAIPVLLVLQIFKRVLDSRNPVFSTARVLHAGKLRCETDFVVLSYDVERRLELAIGEAKDDGGEIDDQDITNLRSARAILLQRLPTCFLVFAKTAQAFTSAERARFEKLKSENVPFILLTNRELEPYHPYWSDNKVPYKYALSMNEMAENGYSRYLDET